MTKETQFQDITYALATSPNFERMGSVLPHEVRGCTAQRMAGRPGSQPTGL